LPGGKRALKGVTSELAGFLYPIGQTTKCHHWVFGLFGCPLSFEERDRVR
jgi:hypothetical protein